MTRREIERLAGAVKGLGAEKVAPAMVALAIGRAVLGGGPDERGIGQGTAAAWKKWLNSCGVTPDAVDHMAEKARGL